MQSAVDYWEFNILNQSTDADIDKELKKKYPVTPEYPSDGNFTPEFIAYNNDYMEVAKKYTVIVLEQFIKSHPDSYASVRVLAGNMGNMEQEMIEKYYGLLSKKRQSSDEGKEILKFIKALKSSAVNSQIKDFVLSGPDGTKVSTKSLRANMCSLIFGLAGVLPVLLNFLILKRYMRNIRIKILR